jgi:hypothetical protein
MSVAELPVPLEAPTDSPPHADHLEVVVRRKATNGLALASLVLGVLWLTGVGSLLAVIFASIAKTQIRQSDGWQSGDGMATAGLALGIVGLSVVVLFGLIVVGAAVSTT